MRSGSALLALLLLLTGRAEAAVYFVHGFDIGCPGNLGSCNGVAFDSTSSQQVWKVGGSTVVNGSPSFSTTVESAASSSNLYSMQINPASGATEYVGTDAGISAGVASLKVGCKLRVDDDGGFGAKREIVVFRDGGASGNYTRGAILSLAHANTVNGVDQYTLNAYYGAQDATVCSGSNYNGRRCTNVATDCPTTNAAEAQCANSLLAVSPVIPEGTWVQFILSLDTGSPAAGDVTVGLWEGTAGLTPTVYSRGTGTRKVGYCSGGSVAGKPCDTNGDCSGGGTCTLTDKVTAKEVRFGVTDTGTGAVDYKLDDCWIYDGDARTNVRFETLTPNGDGTTTDWVDQGGASSIDEDMDENPANDGTDYGTRGSGTTGATHDVALSNIPKPSSSPTPIAVAFSAIAQKNWSTGGRTVDLRWSEHDGTNTTTGTTVQVNDATNWTDDGAASAYHPTWSQTFSVAPDGNAWTTKGLSTVDNLQLRLDRVAASNVNQEFRITRAIAEVVVQQPNATVPTVIPDRDQDGEDTICIAGDSTFHNDDFRFAVVSNLVEPTNIYYFTRGGSKLGDTLAQLSTLIEGGSGGFLPLDAKRGTTGKTCDVFLVEHLANVFTAADPSWGPNFRGISQSGYCQDDGGANQGAGCWCDGKTDDWTSHFNATPAPNITPAARYCVNRGDFKHTARDRASSGLVAVDCNCSTDADCQVGGDGGTATCTGGICIGNALGTCKADAPTNLRNSFAAPGCLNAPDCPNGVCVQARTAQAVENGLTELQAALDAKPTPAPTPPVGGKPIAVYMSAPEGIGLGCWYWTRAAAAAFRGVVIPWAKAHSKPFIDMYARFHRECNLYQICPDPCALERACYRDDVHWNQRGQVTVAAAAVTECLTNALPGEAAGTRTHDGTCSANVCTTGLVGDGCTTAADCDTWSCDFASAP